MTKNERTSAEVATLAGKLLNRMKLHKGRNGMIVLRYQDGGETRYYDLCTPLEFKRVNGSALTQTRDRGKR